MEPRKLPELTQLEREDLQARCAGDYETRTPPSYLRAVLLIAEYAAVLDGYEATVRGRITATLLPNMKLDADITHYGVLRQMKVGDEPLREAAAAFWQIVMEARYHPESRTVTFKVVGRRSAAAWHGCQIPFQGRILTLRDESESGTSKTTYDFTLYNPATDVAASEVVEALQHHLHMQVVDFDAGAHADGPDDEGDVGVVSRCKHTDARL